MDAGEIHIGSGPPRARIHLSWPWLIPPALAAAAVLVSAISALPW